MDKKKEESNSNEQHSQFFLKVEQLRRGSHAMALLLRTDDIIVALNKLPVRGTQKAFNQNLKENNENILTVYRKNIFFNLIAKGPLGINLKEVSNAETEDLLKKTNDYLETLEFDDEFKEFEVYRGEKNLYNEIHVNDTSLLASLLPFVWFFHHKLYMPLFLLVGTLILIGSIAWWLFLAAWVIITVYMSKSSMSLLRGYCLFNEMKIYMKIYAKNNIEVQKTVRLLDKKSNYVFPLIDPSQHEEIEKKSDSDKDLSKAQVTTA